VFLARAVAFWVGWAGACFSQASVDRGIAAVGAEAVVVGAVAVMGAEVADRVLAALAVVVVTVEGLTAAEPAVAGKRRAGGDLSMELWGIELAGISSL
jgi:hypothetical protein